MSETKPKLIKIANPFLVKNKCEAPGLRPSDEPFLNQSPVFFKIILVQPLNFNCRIVELFTCKSVSLLCENNRLAANFNPVNLIEARVFNNKIYRTGTDFFVDD